MMLGVAADSGLETLLLHAHELEPQQALEYSFDLGPWRPVHALDVVRVFRLLGTRSDAEGRYPVFALIRHVGDEARRQPQIQVIGRPEASRLLLEVAAPPRFLFLRIGRAYDARPQAVRVTDFDGIQYRALASEVLSPETAAQVAVEWLLTARIPAGWQLREAPDAARDRRLGYRL